MDHDVILGHQALEGAWKRGVRDGWAFLRNPYPSVLYTVFATVSALLATTVSGVAFQFIMPLTVCVALAVGLILVFAVAIYRAPFVQRNEARKALLELRRRLHPKLAIQKVVVQHPSPPLQDPPADYQAVRVRVGNDSDATAEKCEVKLLGIKPSVKWLPYTEGNRSAHMSEPDIQLMQELPYPIPLSWTSKDEPSIDIPPRGDDLLDVCYYHPEGDSIELAFPSEDMRSQYRQFGTDVVFAIRLDSKGCLPVYCVGKYSPYPQIDDPSVLLYEGQDCPDLKDYQQVEVTPRPQDWDN